MRKLLVLAVLALPAVAGAQTPTGPCVLSARGESYGLSVKTGAVSCPARRRLMRIYLVDRRSPSGWKCRRARGTEAFSAQCRKRTGSPRAVIRAYQAMSGGPTP